MDFGCFSCRRLVEPVWVRLIWIPGTVEPIEIRFVVGDPFLDRLPRRFDRLHGLDVEGRRRRARECDDSLPETVAGVSPRMVTQIEVVEPCANPTRTPHFVKQNVIMRGLTPEMCSVDRLQSNKI